MTNYIVEKLDDEELPVPSAWRASLKQIADEIIAGRIPVMQNIKAISPETIEINNGNIDGYPDKIGPLHEVTWGSSIYTWTDGHWEVLLDLSTSEFETSDLVLHLKVHPIGDQFEFEPGIIYVP